MARVISPQTGQLAPISTLIDLGQLVAAYRTLPDTTIAAQHLAFDTLEHSGSAFERSFNEWQVLAITQAICHHREARAMAGPLFLGIDTHALSAPGCASTLQVLAANGVDVMLAAGDETTPTPAVSNAILSHRFRCPLVEVPVSFKWFANGLHGGALGFAGEESAGATLLRRDGLDNRRERHRGCAALHQDYPTTGLAPGERYASVADEFGSPVARRVEAPATAQQKKQLTALTPPQITLTTLAAERIESILSHVPGNGEHMGGIKVNTANGWFAARPSGTESICKIYSKNCSGKAHLQGIVGTAQDIVDTVIH